MKKMQNWISVKDRLPENGAFVLVCTNCAGDGMFEDEVIFLARMVYLPRKQYKKDFARWDGEAGMDVGFKNEVTHWMPLPEPPERK